MVLVRQMHLSHIPESLGFPLNLGNLCQIDFALIWSLFPPHLGSPEIREKLITINLQIRVDNVMTLGV